MILSKLTARRRSCRRGDLGRICAEPVPSPVAAPRPENVPERCRATDRTRPGRDRPEMMRDRNRRHA